MTRQEINPELVSRVHFGLHHNEDDSEVIAIVLKDGSNIKIPLNHESIAWVGEVHKSHNIKILSLNRLSKDWLKVCEQAGLVESTQWGLG